MSSAQPSLSRSALLRGGSSHPRPFRGRPFARSDDLLAVLRVAVHFAHTRLGRHGILRIGSGELYVRGKLAPDELELLLFRIAWGFFWRSVLSSAGMVFRVVMLKSECELLFSRRF